MTQTEWSHLPNAKHIDWVNASLKANPGNWTAAWDAVWDAAYDAVRDEAWYVVCDEARTKAFDAARTAARTAAYYTARDAARTAATEAAFDAATDAIVALIAYDDCAYMIDSEMDELKILAKLGDQRALLLLPACIVFNETKALTNASIAV